jgi:RecA/RadA recombinase
MTLSALALKTKAYRVAFIDTCNCFSASRLLEIYHSRFPQSSKSDIEGDLSRLNYFRAFEIFQLLDLLQLLHQQLANDLERSHGQTQDSAPLKVIVIDSLAALLSPVLAGVKRAGPRGFGFGGYLLAYVARWLKTLAIKYDLLIVVGFSYDVRSFHL